MAGTGAIPTPITGTPGTIATPATRPERAPPLGRWQLAALLPIGLALAWSLASGTASVLGWWAGELAESAPAGGTVPNGPADRDIRNALQLARALEPGDDVWDRRHAERLERLALSAPRRSPQERDLLAQAETIYRRAALARPTWPLALTPLLRVWAKLGRLDPELGPLYRRAVALGLHEPAAQRALTDLGLAAWPLLDGETRAAVYALLPEALRHQPRFVLERAVAAGRLEVVAPLVATDPRLQAMLEALRTRKAPRS